LSHLAREFHDQIEILRGATLNGAILFTLSWFGLCALYRSRLPAGKLRILLKCASYAPAVGCVLLGLWQMNQHFAHLHEPARAMAGAASTPNPYEGHRDPPLAEAVMVLLGVGGLCLRLTDDNPRLFRNVCLMAGVLTLIAYGSWWWTEVLYYQPVIHSFPTNIQTVLR
jgi:4-amino-4-deoxy-L-arabinose transferase-like glycosyltransferase